uniref:Uncharacterized protein n=1 Tax=Nelumbo nucifera TaxID=4432 RepID=A0A822YZC1_NELNU|nr:TPA_asm: hypothetical protein HUJ06_008693 [Nelumbo nucifera]
MASSVGVAGLRSNFLTDNSTDNSSKENGSGDGGEKDVRLKLHCLLNLVIAHSPMFICEYLKTEFDLNAS